MNLSSVPTLAPREQGINASHFRSDLEARTASRVRASRRRSVSSIGVTLANVSTCAHAPPLSAFESCAVRTGEGPAVEHSRGDDGDAAFRAGGEGSAEGRLFE